MPFWQVFHGLIHGVLWLKKSREYKHGKSNSTWNLYDDFPLTVCLMSIKCTDWHFCSVTNRHSIANLRVSSCKLSFLAGIQVFSKSKTFLTSHIARYLGSGGALIKNLSMGVHLLYKDWETNLLLQIRQIWQCLFLSSYYHCHTSLSKIQEPWLLLATP